MNREYLSFFPYCTDFGSAITGVATLASGANYLLVSGLKPKGKLGKRLMIQRENLQERYREREVLMRKRMDVRRERMRLKQVLIGNAGLSITYLMGLPKLSLRTTLLGNVTRAIAWFTCSS